jgi:hypothetical protein
VTTTTKAALNLVVLKGTVMEMSRRLSRFWLDLGPAADPGYPGYVLVGLPTRAVRPGELEVGDVVTVLARVYADRGALHLVATDIERNPE